MKWLTKLLNRIFIESLTGMAQGLFATLIVGTIVKQIGSFVPGDVGATIIMIGTMATAFTGAGIGVGVAYRLRESSLVVVSSAVTGMIGAYAGQLLAGTVIQGNKFTFSGPGEPLGAFLAAYIGIEVGRLLAGKTKLDILITPIITVGTGASVGLILGPPISEFMTSLGRMINWGTEQQPILMGIIVSVLMGMILTLPISSAALGVILNLSGLAAGAATVGCCCNMVGFAVASYRENKFGGLIAQGIGTSMLQVPNIMKKPIIWLPAILSSAILGPIGTVVLKMQNNAIGSGMGTSGLVGQINTWTVMTAAGEAQAVVLLKILLIQIILPAVVTLAISESMRKIKWIRHGDMKLEL